jgi:parvulin-like peptidyl-prolyl isomerase
MQADEVYMGVYKPVTKCEHGGITLKRTKFNRIVALVVVVAAVAGAGWYAWTKFSATTAGSSEGQSAGQTVAIVNGSPIAQMEIEAIVAQGAGRAAAIDQRITQVVMAGAAEKQFAADSARALNAGRTQLLAQMFAERRITQLRAAVTEPEIASYYEKNLSADEFRRFKLKFLIAKDAPEAQALYAALTTPASPDAKAASERLQYLSKNADGYLLAPEIPYGIGNVVKKMKAGELLQPILVREGILIVKIEDIREGERPPLTKVAQDIRALLANQKMAEEIQQLRKAAKIELKG